MGGVCKFAFNDPSKNIFSFSIFSATLLQKSLKPWYDWLFQGSRVGSTLLLVVRKVLPLLHNLLRDLHAPRKSCSFLCYICYLNKAALSAVNRAAVNGSRETPARNQPKKADNFPCLGLGVTLRVALKELLPYLQGAYLRAGYGAFALVAKTAAPKASGTSPSLAIIHSRDIFMRPIPPVSSTLATPIAENMLNLRRPAKSQTP